MRLWKLLPQEGDSHVSSKRSWKSVCEGRHLSQRSFLFSGTDVSVLQRSQGLAASFLQRKELHRRSTAGGPNGCLTHRGKPPGHRPLGKELGPDISPGSNWHLGWGRRGPVWLVPKGVAYSLLRIKAVVGPVTEGNVNNLSGVLQWKATDPTLSAVDKYVR